MHELDLHGLSVDEALRVFVEFYNRHIRSGSREPLRIVHGYGASGQGGKIRRKIRALLEGSAVSLDWKAGEDLEGNLGVTIVYPRKILHAREDQLVTDILAFCSIPRTESKITGEFRNYAAREIKQAIRSLVRQDQMKEVFKDGRETYVRSVLTPTKR
jgi:Smr domain